MCKEKIMKFNNRTDLEKEDFRFLLTTCNPEILSALQEKADSLRIDHFGNNIYIRGLIEISNYCSSNCFYCGIRCSNKDVSRYRLKPSEIIKRCDYGYSLGFRTFVLQGGEDIYFSDEILVPLITSIKDKYPDCAVTLSLGERSRTSYKNLFNAGADRYLLRHETADELHYSRLHPEKQTFENRMKCLYALKETGFQTGCGLMVGSPYQTIETLIKDLEFIKEFQPEMIGIGPFIPAQGTPFENKAPGSVELTLRILSIIRLIHPDVLLPATTALFTLDGSYNRGILAGANVVMPNLNPPEIREKYVLYHGKGGLKNTTDNNLTMLKNSLKEINCEILIDRGDYRKRNKNVQY